MFQDVFKSEEREESIAEEGSGFRFRVQGLGFRFRVQVWGLGFRS